MILLRQEEVPCLVDGEAHLARDPSNSGRLQTKPHGHGDVHALLHTSGLAKRFLQKGKKWLCFFQDTNALLFKVIASVVGVSAEKRLHMNSVAVPRQPRDAMGSIARITASDGTCLTLNVEYNQLESFLKSTICPEGDVANDTGLNCLITGDQKRKRREVTEKPVQMIRLTGVRMNACAAPCENKLRNTDRSRCKMRKTRQRPNPG